MEIAFIGLASAVVVAALSYSFEHRRWLRSKRLDAWTQMVAVIPLSWQRISRARQTADLGEDELAALWLSVEEITMVLATVRVLGPAKVAEVAATAPTPPVDREIDIEEATQSIGAWTADFVAVTRRHLRSESWLRRWRRG